MLEHVSIQILFPVAYTGPKQSWNTSIRPSRSPYMPSLRIEHDFSWQDLPRARCLACALKALTTANTPSPQSRYRPRPKSAPPRLSNLGQKARKSDYRPSTSSSTRKSLQPKASKSPRISPIRCKEGPSTASKSSSKKAPRVRSSYPKMSTPKSSTSVKKSLSFSPETKEETDSAPKPKGIRGGGRRRKAQLAMMNGEELSTDDPRHAYYVLIHEDLKSGKPTASVKPIMSGEGEAVGAEKSPVKEEVKTSENRENVDVVVTNTGAESEEVTVVKKVTYVISDAEGDIALGNNVMNGVHDEHSGTPEEMKVVTLGEDEAAQNVLPDEKPPLVSNNNTKSPPNVTEEKSGERDWSKPKAIRGRRKKPKADMNGNESSKPEEKQEVTSTQDDVVNGAQEMQQQKLVLANGDS